MICIGPTVAVGGGVKTIGRFPIFTFLNHTTAFLVSLRVTFGPDALPLLRDEAMVGLVMLTSFCQGVGNSHFWVAQGYYTTQCIAGKVENSGLYNGICWAVYVVSNIIIALVGA